MSEENYWIEHAIREIKKTYDDEVKVTGKDKSLLKFGSTSNADSGVKTTIMTLPLTQAHETYLTDNLITHVSSGDAGDTQTLHYEGHEINSDGELYFRTSEVTLQGQTKVALPLPLARVSRAYNKGTTSLTGPVYFYEDVAITDGVPNVDSAVHMIIAANKNQTEKAATSTSRKDYLIITSAFFGGNRGNIGVNFDFNIETRQGTLSFRPLFDIPMRSTGGGSVPVVFKPHLIIPKNSDVRMTVISNADNSSATGWMHGVLAAVIP
jgi:hypothetical protein